MGEIFFVKIVCLYDCYCQCIVYYQCIDGIGCWCQMYWVGFMFDGNIQNGFCCLFQWRVRFIGYCQQCDGFIFQMWDDEVEFFCIVGIGDK